MLYSKVLKCCQVETYDVTIDQFNSCHSQLPCFSLVVLTFVLLFSCFISDLFIYLRVWSFKSLLFPVQTHVHFMLTNQTKLQSMHPSPSLLDLNFCSFSRQLIKDTSLRGMHFSQILHKHIKTQSQKQTLTQMSVTIWLTGQSYKMASEP